MHTGRARGDCSPCRCTESLGYQPAGQNQFLHSYGNDKHGVGRHGTTSEQGRQAGDEEQERRAMTGFLIDELRGVCRRNRAV
jgi:hypothetical protein